MSKLHIIKNEAEVDTLIKYCKKTGYCCPDFETTGLEYHNKNEYPLILGVSFQPGSAWIIPLGHDDSPFKHCWERILRKFGREVIENPNIIKIGWHVKFEYKWFLRFDIVMKGRLFDAMLGKYCLDEERPHDLKSFVANFFEAYAGYEQLIKSTAQGEDNKVDWRKTDYKSLCIYCGKDCDLTFRGWVYLESKLIKLGFYNLFRNLLMGMTVVFAEGEYHGILVDRPYLEALVKEYALKIHALEKRLMSIPKVAKFERTFRKRHINALINSVRLDIEEIRKEAPPNADRLIWFRENKIKGFLEGRFTKREAYDGFNFKSPKQLIEFLFKKRYGLRFKPVKFTKDKQKQSTKNPSTDEDALKKLEKKDKTGFIKGLLEYRTLEKLDSTYIRGMLPLLDANDRVHANFKIHGTVTGRTSCVAPNLQNIPRGTTAADIKKMFIPPPGYVLLEVDYSQAELRIVAELSQDKNMIEIFQKNYNVHVATACRMNKCIEKYDKIKAIIKIGDSMDAKDLEKPENKKYLKWLKEKKKGKSLNFSILYQQGDAATAETLECSEEEAAKFKKEWFAAFPGVKKWIDRQKKKAHRDGYVYNLFGRKRRLHDINCGIKYFEAENERQAVNAPIQGSSGDFTLFSQVVIRQEQLKGNFPRDMQHVYCVHDSIGYYVRPKDIHDVVPKIIKICDNPETKKYFGFRMKSVFMKVSAEVGKNWADLKDYDEKADYSLLTKTG